MIRVVIIESEYGAGLTIEEGGEFATMEEAKAFCKAFNAPYDEQQATPSYYKIARIVRP